MTDDIKPEVIKMTQDTLGKHIKKPPLTDKLLKKPPFRFLHDVVTSTIRDTKFLSGLYSDSEMVSDNIKDRDGKIAFLQKLIDCVTIVTDKKLSVRPSKIVAGLEPTKTNELLQAIGYALNKKLDSTEAVAQVTGGGNTAKTKSKTKDDKKTKEKTEKVKQSPTSKTSPDTKKTSDSKLTRKPSVEKVPSNKIKESPRTKDKLKDDKKKSSSTTKVSKTKDKNQTKDRSPKEAKPSKEKIDTPKTSPKEEPKPEPVPEILEKIDTLTPIITPEITINNNAPESIKSEMSPLPPEKFEIPETPENVPEKPIKEDEIREKSITPNKKRSKKETPMVANFEPEVMMSKDTVKELPARPKTSLRPPSVRPSSARPGAPRLKDRNEIILPPDEVISMGKVNVIVENFSNQEDDNEETVVVEEPQELTFQEPPKPEIALPAEKGHLVNQILEQLEESSLETEHKPRVEIEWEGGGKRNREAASREMEKLRDSIQTLTRAANPLGKLMNFLQEDVDSMRSELKSWIEVNEKLSGEIKTQERLNEESIEPLKKQLNKLEEDILKQHELISSTQANILRNEQKIKMLLTREG